MRNRMSGDGPRRAIRIVIELIMTDPEQHGWQLPVVKEEHIQLIAWLWHEVLPDHIDITQEDAAELWAQFRANPLEQEGAVGAMKYLAQQAWDGYVETN